jgi:hypothetical protein
MYAVDPCRPAVTLAPYLRGEVIELDGSTGSTCIGGVTVEIVSAGPDYDQIDTTRNNGFYTINNVAMGVPFAAQASKADYVAAVRTTPHDGRRLWVSQPDDPESSAATSAGRLVGAPAKVTNLRVVRIARRAMPSSMTRFGHDTRS